MKRSLLPLLMLLTLAGAVPVGTSPDLPTLRLDTRTLKVTPRVRVVPREPREDAPDFFPPRSLAVSLGPADAELRVYPVDALLKQYPERGPDSVRGQIDALRALLRARPAKPSRDATLPYLPTAFAGQVLHGAVRFLDFPGGAGVRYLVAYSQEVAPLTRGQVFYTFQGLTRDGKYLVSLDHPVDAAFLPRDLFGPGVPARERALLATLERGADVDAAFRAYTRDVSRQLDTLDTSPALARLDAVARSVTLTAPKGR